MTWLTVLAVSVGLLILARTGMLVFAAELGRRKDMIKHIYRGATDFHIAVVIPYYDSTKLSGLQELLKALDKQDYPADCYKVHIITNEDSVFGLPHDEDLPKNAKIWSYPDRHAKNGELISWLVERVLAGGGPTKLFAFLEPDNVVRPDYLKNITTRAYDCFAMQGYVALKRPPQGIVATTASLSTRLMNRIENAGRFHLGLSSRLMNTGWVVRQELLEMIPYRQGNDVDNLEYTALLNSQGYRVHWAPNVVVYRDEKISFARLLIDKAHSVLNRTRMALRYTAPFMLQGFRDFDLGLLDQVWCIVKPPAFLVGLVAVLGSFVALATPSLQETFSLWWLFTLAFFAVHISSIAVARFPLKDVMFYAFVAPVVYLASTLFFPAFLVAAVGENIFKMTFRPKASRVGLRFDESEPPRRVTVIEKHNLTKNDWTETESLLEAEAQQEEQSMLLSSSLKGKDPEFLRTLTNKRGSISRIFEPEPETTTLSDLSQNWSDPWQTSRLHTEEITPKETTHMLPISNGKQSVMCTLKIMQDAEGSYSMVLEYKTMSFQTKSYRILDQAYYEVETRLKEKGFTIVSCGSCAYFYRPTAGNVYDIAPEAGFCLFGRQGQDLNIQNGTITAVSEACAHHTNMELRADVVQAWQDSLETEHAGI